MSYRSRRPISRRRRPADYESEGLEILAVLVIGFATVFALLAVLA